MNQFKARCISVYDGDTLTVILDLGFGISYTAKLRLYGLNTPEIRCTNPKEKALGKEARDFLRELILNKDIIVEIMGVGKYGRQLAQVYYNGKCINDLLIKKGYAREYFGGARKGWYNND